MYGEKTLTVLCSESGTITFYDLLGQVTFKANLSKGINIFNYEQLSCDNSVILYKAKLRSNKIETGKIITLK